MDIIIPCAGLSTRFPNMRPKYLLTSYDGRRMIELAADPYINSNHQLHAVILKQHDQEHGSAAILREIFGDKLNIIMLDEPTSGPAETVYRALLIANINDQPFMVHDCDSVFTHETIYNGNRICVSSLHDRPDVRNASNKSYVSVNDHNIVVSMVEKQVIGDLFSVGGYQFLNSEKFKATYESLAKYNSKEIFISNIIDRMISDGEIFIAEKITGYFDLGTKEDWETYNDKPTIFCDIDGTLVKNQAPQGLNSYHTKATPLTNNLEVIKNALNRGCQIIFTTSRPEQFRTITQSLLDEIGLSGCQLLMGMHHSRRILVNDYANSNPYPSAVAINLKRDDDSLNETQIFRS